MVWSAALGFPGEIGRFECRRRDDEPVIPGAADKPIVAGTAVEHVISLAAFQHVITGAAEQVIVAGPADEPVVAAVPEQQVIAATAVHDIIAVRPGNDAAADPARHAGRQRKRGAPVKQGLDGMAPELIEHRHSSARRKRQHQVVVYVLGVGQRIGIDENRIVATAVRNCAVAGADYSIDGREKIVVITRPGSQSIVALKSAELIVTTAAVEDIV